MPNIIHKTNAAGFDEGLGCILSDLTVDAYGDIVGDPTDSNLGWDTKDFMKNPIALWSHSSRDPIGTWADVHVKDGALRGHLHLAPPGSTKLVDELRALLAANVVKGISVGFTSQEYKPRSNGGVHYLKQKLVEASLVSIPANPSALLTAKALGISKETIAKIFKEGETSSNVQRIRDYRQSIRKLKDKISRETNLKTRASMQRACQALEKAEREMSASLEAGKTDADRRREARAMIEASEAREAARLLAEYDASPVGQAARHQEETIANYTRASNRLPQDPPPNVSKGEGNFTIWRGQRIDLRLTWRGKRI